MRIAIIADPLDNQLAGVHTYTRNLVEALSRYDDENEYILIRERKTGEFPGMREVAIPNTRLPIGWASFRLFFLVPWKCRQLKVDAVLEPAHFGPWNLPKNIKRITVIHDLTPIKFPQFHRWHSQLLQKLFLRRILKKADLLLANSQNTANDLADYFPPAKEKTSTIPLGRDEFFQPTEDTAPLKKYGIQMPYLLYTGTIEPRKDLATLLEAYRLLRSSMEDPVQLVIAGGKGWKTKHFDHQLARHPYRADIIRTGYVPKEALPALYSHCAAFVYPSLYEGFGLPILEAMSCGAAIVAANNSSLTEVGGKAAIYFETGQATALAEAIEQVLKDTSKRETMQQSACIQAANFSWQTYAGEITRLLEKSINFNAHF